MKTAFLVFLVQAQAMCSPCVGQAVKLEAVFAAGSAIELGVGSSPTAGIILSGRHRSELRTRANAVVTGRGYALTSAHCVSKSGKTLVKLLVASRPAAVVLVSGNLALLSICRDVVAPAAVIRKEWDASRPAVGEQLTHIYFSHVHKRPARRFVTWNGLSSINEGFVEGMSGSGLYSLDGLLVGLAEWTTGYAEGSLSLAAFASQTASMGLHCFGEEPGNSGSPMALPSPDAGAIHAGPTPIGNSMERL